MFKERFFVFNGGPEQNSWFDSIPGVRAIRGAVESGGKKGKQKVGNSAAEGLVKNVPIVGGAFDALKDLASKDKKEKNVKKSDNSDHWYEQIPGVAVISSVVEGGKKKEK